MDTCIVIPCYNEASRLNCGAFVEFIKQCDSVSFLFVNDGSRDKTLEMLQTLCSLHSGRLFLLNLGVNRGKAEAVRLGLLRVIQEVRPRFVGFWDADLATPLEAIPDFIEKLAQNDKLQMIFGARIVLLGRHVKRRNSRHYLGRVFATIVSVVLDLAIYDTQCGAKLFRVSESFSRILIEPFLSRWVFDVEIIARLIQAAGGDRSRVAETIFELPLMRWEDVAGSKVRPFDFFIAAADIFRIRQRYLT